MPTFRVMTYNILYGGVERETLIRDVVAAIHPDIAIFTEVTAADAFDAIAEAVGPHRAGRDGRTGREYPVIVSRWPIVGSQLHGPPWARRKWIEATVRPFGGAPITVHGIHLVPQPLWPMEIWRREEVRWLLQRLQSGARVRQIVAGDFNALAAGDTQTREGAPWWIRAQWSLQGGAPRWALKVLSGAGYIDCYRTCHPHAAGFTVPAWSPGARIDYVFASPDLESALRSSGVLESATGDRSNRAAPRRTLAELMGWKAVASMDGEASDHLPVWVDFEWRPEDTAS